MPEAPISLPIPVCRFCGAATVVRNGRGRLDQQVYLCTTCRRNFVLDPQRRPVPDDTKALIVRLLGERVSLRGICRVVGVSRTWLQEFVNERYRDQSQWRLEPDETPPEPAPEKK